MKTTEIVGYKREDLGKTSSKALRAEGSVPSVLYSNGGEAIHFHAPAYLFRELVYTPDAYIVNLNIEGEERKCILQDTQFHPVSDMMMHADFLEIYDDKPVTMEIPVELYGKAPGASAGGQVYIKNKKLKVKAIPSKLPETVKVDIGSLELGNSVRVKDLEEAEYEIVTPGSVSIVQIIIPRALKAALQEKAKAEAAEGAEAAE